MAFFRKAAFEQFRHPLLVFDHQNLHSATSMWS
jgi:hypothetical protein